MKNSIALFLACLLSGILNAQAMFSSNNQVGYKNGTIQFNDESTGATSWQWDFGDGSPTSLLQNPTHVYTSASRFDVTLTINGGSSTLTRTQYIQILPNRGTPYVVASDGGTFETNPDDFGSQSIRGGVNKWERGVPSNFLVTVNSPVNVWKTDLDADLTDGNYACVLQTPSYNFTSSASAYTLRFRRSMEVVGCNGPFAVQLQYTTDRGQTWTRLGVNADPASTNWYNRGPATGCPIDPAVFSDQYGWTITGNNALSTYNLTTGVPSLVGQPEVAFRFVLSVEPGFPLSYYAADGFMIDDFEILGPSNAPYVPVINNPPVANCQNLSGYLNSSGNFNMIPAMLNNGSTDDNGITSMTISPTSLNCSNIGPNNVTLTVYDAEGLSSSCTSIVTILDSVSPVVTCHDTTLYLGTSGTLTVTPAMLHNLSSDNCGIASLDVTPNFFDCGTVAVGAPLTFTAIDVSGNSSSCISHVNVYDNTPPVAICRNVTAYLDVNGNTYVSPAMINNGSYDNCSIVMQQVNPNTFTCANLGANTVTYTVWDAFGLNSSCTATVTVLDTIRPVANCQNATVYLSTSGTGLVTPSLINLGSSDNCGISAFGISPSGFLACNRLGTSAFTLSVQDINMNLNTCVSMVTVLDTVRPIALAHNATISLAGGIANINASLVNNGSSDNCTIASMSVSPNSFTCANTGPNTVTLTVTDNSGNTSTTTCVVTVLGAATASSTSTTICEGQTGTITASGNGSFSWSTGATTASISENPLSTTVYTVTVTTVEGCSASAIGTINVNQNPNVTTSATFIPCNGGTSTVTVSATGGTSPYSGTGTFTVNAGSYSYPVTDANGCSSTTTVVITEPTVLTSSSSATSILCNGGTSTVTVSASGGTAPYSGTGNFVVNAGPQSYTVTDSNGCSSTSTITITEPATLSASSAATSILCYASASTVTISATGGTSPYSGTGVYGQWAGSVIYPVTDANGCASTVTVTLTEPAELVGSSSATSILCNGGTSTVTVVASGGTPPYSGTGSYTVNAGSYFFPITDANGCGSSGPIVITEPSAISTTATQINVSCFGGSDGSIDLTVNGGTGPYTYDWNSGMFTTEDLSGLTAGTYSGTLTDANGCTDSGTITITEPTALVASVTSSINPSTCGGTDGSVDISVSGGTVSYSYVWSNGATAEDLNAVGAGTYSCTISDANGCTTTANATLNDPGAPAVTLNLPMDTACQTTQLPFVLSGESPSGGIFSGPGVTGNTFDPMNANPGYNVISYSYTDLSGCTGSTIDSIYVDLCMGMKEAVVQNSFVIMPNPNNGTFMVNLKHSNVASIVIYDSEGRLVTEQKISGENSVGFTLESSGIYLVTATMKDGSRNSQRVVVNK